MVSQRRYALRRHSSMNSGSFFFAEIVRIMSSLSPAGTVSVSTSVTNPYAYSRLTSASIPELIPTPWRFYTSLRRLNLKQFCRDSQANGSLCIPLSCQHLGGRKCVVYADSRSKDHSNDGQFPARLRTIWGKRRVRGCGCGEGNRGGGGVEPGAELG